VGDAGLCERAAGGVYRVSDSFGSGGEADKSCVVLRHLEATAPLVSIGYLLVFSVYLVVFARLYGLYRSQDVRSGLNEQRLTVQATLTAGLMLCGTLYVMKQYSVSRLVVGADDPDHDGLPDGAARD
jgi:hypothetical protein